MQYALDAISAGTASQAQIQNGGNALWERLRAGTIGAELEPLRDENVPLAIRLDVSGADEAIPWEAMIDDRRKRPAAAHDRVLVRHARHAPAAKGPRATPLSVLIVVPGRSGLPVDAEIPAIAQAFRDRGVAIRGGKCDVLRTRVTTTALSRAFEAKIAADGAPYDIVHFIGHGIVGTDGVPALELNGQGDEMHEMPPAALTSMIEAGPPALIVLNACHSGAAAETKGLVGFGQELVAAGVRAVVAMQQAIRNDLAIEFADAFYGELARCGRVDLATTAGRRRLLQKQQADTAGAFAIPVLFLAHQAETLFVPSQAQEVRPAATTPVIGPPPPPLAIPEQLLTAVRGGWCIPVLGPALVTPTRDGGALSWTPGPLAQHLAQKCQFPEQSILQAMTTLGHRIDHLVLQRVCQHYEKLRARPALLREVKAVFEQEQRIPAIHERLSSWPVPGFVCTHFDGFLERAFKRSVRAYHAVSSLEARAPSASESGPLLVHLRGSASEPNTLRLTEADHDRLLDAMNRMDRETSAVFGLVTAQAGRSLLVLGASSWDPWLRHLLWTLIPRDSYEQNTVFIAHHGHTKADEAAWSAFAVEWINAAPEDVVAAITEQL
ncbi:CHAT domain-containing protein [Sorangium sp. So ce1014]|uniref:CHAT domain-containing protein n=1 Tax=Sorangium sp. So ce1014 TaxID=3133326 RepID=UPI003F5E7FFE